MWNKEDFAENENKLEQGLGQIEKMKLIIFKHITKEFIDSVIDISENESFLTDDIIFRIRIAICAEKESVKIEKITYPLNWKEAFKERWFPKHILKKFPVKYHTTIIDVKAIYPWFKQKLPNEECRLIAQRIDL
jgi:hypothetical protein